MINECPTQCLGVLAACTFRYGIFLEGCGYGGIIVFWQKDKGHETALKGHEKHISNLQTSNAKKDSQLMSIAKGTMNNKC